MLNLNQRVTAFSNLGDFLRSELANPDSNWIAEQQTRAKLNNGWFEPRETRFAMEYWANQLTKANLNRWVETESAHNIDRPIPVGLILAGNIPMVGFHDVLSTIILGNNAIIKLSRNDDVLIPALIQKLTELDSAVSEHFEIVEKLVGHEAVIATGSNNSTRYFEQYFGSVPNIIRGNRTGVALLNGEETEEDLHGLMKDCFQYFGLGCRNVTKLYLPNGYDLNRIFKASLPFAYLMDNKKYNNNYTYHKALMMMERKNVLENELILMIEEPSLFSPVSVLNYEYYNSTTDLNHKMEKNLDDIQCIIGRNHRTFGTAQAPALNDYADGVNTLEFLSKLHKKQLTN
ncbi:MAG: acyl-CoA reductase [Salibacteraceae bacterium]